MGIHSLSGGLGLLHLEQKLALFTYFAPLIWVKASSWWLAGAAALMKVSHKRICEITDMLFRKALILRVEAKLLPSRGSCCWIIL